MDTADNFHELDLATRKVIAETFKLEAERRKLDAENEKFLAERRKLELEAEALHRWRYLAVPAGIVALAGAIGGLVVTLLQRHI